jgi:DNA modification methylase
MIQTQLIFCGDNLQKLREIPDESIDLVYIDPPFNSNRNYEIFWGDSKEKRSFDDRFGAVEHYIAWMRPFRASSMCAEKVRHTGYGH